jgi:excisionase family DNA binding protein
MSRPLSKHPEWPGAECPPDPTAPSGPKQVGRGRKADRGPPDADTPVTVKEAAAVLRVNPKTIYSAILRGQLQAIRVGGVILIPRRVFEKMLREGNSGA